VSYQEFTETILVDKTTRRFPFQESRTKVIETREDFKESNQRPRRKSLPIGGSRAKEKEQNS
jgi:hypothetical protein